MIAFARPYIGEPGEGAKREDRWRVLMRTIAPELKPLARELYDYGMSPEDAMKRFHDEYPRLRAQARRLTDRMVRGGSLSDRCLT